MVTGKEGTVTSGSGSVWSAALLISGACLGAGLLALPIQTGLAGLLPALTGLIGIWGLMLASGIIMAEAFVDIGRPSAGLFTLYEHGLGKWSRWLVTPGFLLVFYGILVAYLSGSGAVLSSLLHVPHLEWLLLLLFFLVSSGVVLVGLVFIHRANAGFMALLIGSFMVMLFLVAKNLESRNLVYQDWNFLPSALPIIICAFAYQNIIPSICTSLHNDRGRIRQALFYGTLLSLLVNGLWIIVVVGVLPLDGSAGSLLTAFHRNQPATIPLAQNIPSGNIQFFSLLFSMAALFTSYVAVGEGLRNFLADLFGGIRSKNGKDWLVACLTFIPPLTVSLIYPQLFLKMLNLVGGVGVVLLFGILPSFIFFRKAQKLHQQWRQIIGLLLCVIFSALLILECGQEAGLLQIHPQIEYMWKGR
jgi:tyrosine-specific transport protein